MGYDFVANLPRLPRPEEKQSVSPITQFRALTWMQLALFFSGWLAWLVDAIDFFAVSLTASRLVTIFNTPLNTITLSITLTLLFRPLGAVIFGLLSDRYGRKWPLIANLVCCAVLSLGTAFTTNFQSFLAVRSLFGIAMGGIWGGAASLALENMPVMSRGLFSGILQQGYAVGYLLAAVFNLTLVTQYGDWRILFFCAAGFSALAVVVRLMLPESQYFLDRQAAAKASGTLISSSEKSKIFIREVGRALKTHWVRCIYAILLMTGFNFFSHGSQDLYPTYLTSGKGIPSNLATIATIIGNCGAVAGGFVAGWVSQFLGRRITIIVFCIWTVVFLPLWLLPTTFGPLAAGAFFVQFGVQGAWGVVPVYLTEISPVAFRAVFPGVAYQLGNMVSSASSQIESTAGGNLTTAAGLPDYGKVSAILIGVVAGWIILLCLVGNESHSAHFEHGHAAFEKGAGRDIIDEDAAPTHTPPHVGEYDKEKGSLEEHENVNERAL